MYQKPTLEKFGSLRELTLVGFGSDGDGGLPGTGWLDGCLTGCSDRS